MRTFRSFVSLALVAAVLPASVSIARQTEPGSSAAKFMPPNLAIVATLRDGDTQVNALRNLLKAHRFTESPTYRTLQGNPEFMQARITLAGLAEAAQTEVWTGIGALLGRELLLGLAPGDGDQPQFVAVSVPRDAQLADRILNTIYVVAGLVRDGRPDPARSRQVNGVIVFALENGIYHCRLDQAIVLSNSMDLLRAAIDRRGSGKQSLADTPAYQQALGRVPRDAVAWAYGDMNVLRQAIGQAGDAPAQMGNPLAAVLFGGWWHSILHAQSAVVSATPAKDRLTIDLSIDASEPLPPTHRGFAPVDLGETQWSAAAVGGYVAEVTITRGWEDLFAEREAIMTLSAAGDFVNFANTLTTLMGQVDFVDEIMASVSGPVRLVIARQDFSAKPYTPMPVLPSFALVVPLRFPDGSDIRHRLHSAAITALGILNADAGQNKRPTFLIDVERYLGHRIVTAEYPDPRASGRGMGMNRDADDGRLDDAEKDTEQSRGDQTVGIAYNFAPSTAVLDEHFIVATSPDLLRRLIDVIDTAGRPGAVGAAGHAADSVSINVPEVVKILRANREVFVVSSMLNEDKPRLQAEGEIDMLFGAIEYAERVEISARRDDRAPTATLTLTLRTPAHRRE